MAGPFEPRAQSLVVGGIPRLAHMIDKARAESDGSIGDHEYPSWIDRQVLHELGISADQFMEMASSTSGDAEIIVRVRQACELQTMEI